MPTSEPRWPARFDDLLDEHLARSTPAGRREYERDGIPQSHLKACEPEGRDGTKLPDSVKVYLPHPDGPWGMVFKIVVPARERPRLRYLAFGARHHPKASNALTVYQLADRQLNS
jgi:hypothetical protein